MSGNNLFKNSQFGSMSHINPAMPSLWRVEKSRLVLLVLPWFRLASVGNQDDSGIFRNTKQVDSPCLLFSPLNDSFSFDVQAKKKKNITARNTLFPEA